LEAQKKEMEEEKIWAEKRETEEEERLADKKGSEERRDRRVIG
jgi:hypothetical protein